MDETQYIQAILSLIFVLGLIGILSIIVRKFGIAGTIPKRKGNERIIIEEMKMIDARRKLILIKRDDKEHLLLIITKWRYSN